MGRHSDPDPKWFWLSLGAAAAKALLLIAVAVALVFGGVRWLTDNDTTPTPSVEQPSATASAEPVSSAPAPTVEDVDTDALDDDTTDATDEDGGDEAPVAATVQVLNASGHVAALAHVVSVLEELGYEVVSQGVAARGYEQTTVFWSEGFQEEAMVLHRADRRFGVVQSNQKLDATINLHVVIGADWVATDGPGSE